MKKSFLLTLITIFALNLASCARSKRELKKEEKKVAQTSSKPKITISSQQQFNGQNSNYCTESYVNLYNGIIDSQDFIYADEGTAEQTAAAETKITQDCQTFNSNFANSECLALIEGQETTIKSNDLLNAICAYYF
jgi:hypothetical protein